MALTWTQVLLMEAAARHPDYYYSHTPYTRFPHPVFTSSSSNHSVSIYLLLCLPRPATIPPAVFLRDSPLSWSSLLSLS
ncbi:hypothetical protein NQZ68_029317 [Dissostichus eleginoides]|nr:hypothetical protein NQZ68_029317 [Dissostichus eleginoides]